MYARPRRPTPGRTKRVAVAVAIVNCINEAMLKEMKSDSSESDSSCYLSLCLLLTLRL